VDGIRGKASLPVPGRAWVCAAAGAAPQDRREELEPGVGGLWVLPSDPQPPLCCLTSAFRSWNPVCKIGGRCLARRRGRIPGWSACCRLPACRRAPTTRCRSLGAGCLARAEYFRLSIMTLTDEVCPNEMTEAVGSGSDTPPCSYVPEIGFIHCQAGGGDPAPSLPLPGPSWTKTHAEKRWGEARAALQSPNRFLCLPQRRSQAAALDPAQGLSSGEFAWQGRAGGGRVPGLAGSPASSPLVSPGETDAAQGAEHTQLWQVFGALLNPSSPCSRCWVASGLVLPLRKLGGQRGERGVRRESGAGGGLLFGGRCWHCGAGRSGEDVGLSLSLELAGIWVAEARAAVPGGSGTLRESSGRGSPPRAGCRNSPGRLGVCCPGASAERG